MRLKYTILYVDDVGSSVEFYEKAFGLERGMLHESGDYGELKTGDTTLAFASRGFMKDQGRNPGIADPAAPVFEIAFETEDVASALEKARQSGAVVVQEAREEPWGQTSSYVTDNNGYLVEICSPVKGSVN